MSEKTNVIITNKTEIKATSVIKINSLDNKHFNLETSLGKLNITGENLEMVELDQSNKTITIKGEITGVFYKEENKKKETFVKKLFK